MTKTSNAESIHVLSSLEELKKLINTLVSRVDESFIQQMKVAAANLFFVSGNRKSNLYEGEITGRILRDFGPQIYASIRDRDQGY